MKTLKHNTQNNFAIVTEKTIYLANSDTRQIYKVFGSSTFNSSAFTEGEDLSEEEFKEMKANFVVLEKQKKEAELKKMAEYRLAQYELRKEEIKNLWGWRHGEVDAFLVCTFVELNDNSSSNGLGYTSELIFGKENAYERFNELKESEEPYYDHSSSCCYFVTEINELYGNHNKLEYTSIEDLKYLFENNRDLVERNEYAPSIENCDYIITFNKYDSFYNKTNRGSINNIEERRTWSGWVLSSYYTEQKTTADLGFNQIAVTAAELESDYYDYAVNFGIISEENETEE